MNIAKLPELKKQQAYRVLRPVGHSLLIGWLELLLWYRCSSRSSRSFLSTELT
jgi:hypothetical protein